MILRSRLAQTAILLGALAACSPASLDGSAAGTNAGGAAAQAISVTVVPATAALSSGESARFAAAVYGTASSAVTWSVREAGGGSVDAQGLYTAPSAAGTYHVVATSSASGAASAEATVTVGAASTGAAGPAAAAPTPAASTPAPTVQPTYFVDCAAGSDSSTGKSASAPWKTLAKVNGAMRSFSPGDVIAFKAGTTCVGSLTVSASGTSSTPLTFTAYGSGSAPVLDPQSAHWGIDVSGQYVTIDGLVIHSTRCSGGAACVDGGQSDTTITATEAGVNISAGRVTVRNTEIVNTGFGIEAWAGNNTLGPNNYIHDLRMLDQGGGFYGAVCWEIRSGGNQVLSSRCVNAIAQAPSSGSGLDGGAFELFLDGSGSIDGNVFAWNWVDNADGIAEMTCKTGCASLSNNEWHHNVFRSYENPAGSWHSMAGVTAAGNRWENNTVVGYASDTKYEFAWFEDDSAADAVSFRNNILVLGGQSIVFGNDQDSSHGPAHDHNLYWKLGGGGSSSSVSGGGMGSGDRYADPRFVNLAQADYHLQAGSPAVGAGSASVAYPFPSVDFAGAPVPSATSAFPDLGAFQGP